MDPNVGKPGGGAPEPSREDLLRLWYLQDAVRRAEARKGRRLLVGAGAAGAGVLLAVAGFIGGRVLAPGAFVERPVHAASPAPRTTNPCAARSRPANPCAPTAAAATNPCALPGASGASDDPGAEPADPAAPVTAAEIDAARRRVQRMEDQATDPARRVGLEEKRAVAESWIYRMGHDRARLMARKTTRAFVAAAKAAQAEKGPGALDVAEARELAKYWRDVCDLIVVAPPGAG